MLLPQPPQTPGNRADLGGGTVPSNLPNKRFIRPRERTAREKEAGVAELWEGSGERERSGGANAASLSTNERGGDERKKGKDGYSDSD